MSFSWRDYLSLANELSGRRARPYSPDARSRAAISRAYYAAFIEARNFLRDRDGISVPNDGSVHNFVISSFRASSQRQRVIIGEHLERLRSYRNYADYQDIMFRLNQRVNESLTLANRVINTLDRL
jgi:uncharacterized protein (UPF0332 family)